MPHPQPPSLSLALFPSLPAEGGLAPSAPIITWQRLDAVRPWFRTVTVDHEGTA